MRGRTLVAVTIPAGASLSGDVNVNDLQIVGIQMPAGWDAAGIAFAALLGDGTTFGKVQDAAGTEVVITSPAAATYVAIAPTVATIGLGRIRVRSGTAAVPVNQTADRVFALVCVG